MSMQHHLPKQVVRPDPWTLFCAECSQKMKIMRATPAQEGRETRTYECDPVTTKGLAWSLNDGEPLQVGFARF